MKELRNWRTCSSNDGKQNFCLVGNVYNDKRFKDGTYIITSPVENIINNITTTKSGSEYKLDKCFMSFTEALLTK